MAMQLTHDFTVPASLDETWAAFNDIEGVAGCFPGATVTGAEGDSFEGTCKVKLGPIALVYKGAGAFVEKDRDAGRMKIEAKGKDKRGNGTAGADVTATLAEADGGTRVTVVTDLNITGKPAQFGRGVMQDVSDKLLAQFVDCLSQRLSGPEADANAAAAGDQDAGPASQPTGAAAGTPGTDATGDPDSGPASAPPADAVPLGPESQRPETPRAAPSRPPAQDDALDLGATVLPVLLKAYWRQGLGVLAVLALVVGVLRRRRG